MAVQASVQNAWQERALHYGWRIATDEEVRTVFEWCPQEEGTFFVHDYSDKAYASPWEGPYAWQDLCNHYAITEETGNG